MTVGEALTMRATDSKLCLTDACVLNRLLIETWPELWWAELIPGLDEAPEERLRVALIRPLTKNGDS